MRRLPSFKKKTKSVSIKVHPDFYSQFDKIRKKLEMKLGNISLSQSTVSKIINEAGLNIPKNLDGVLNDKR